MSESKAPELKAPINQARDRRSRPVAANKRIRSIVLALLVHGLLIAFLVIGVRWNTQKPVAVQAELWVPPPPKVEPTPTPKVEPKPEPMPEPKVELPPPEPPKPVEKPIELPKPDIALEKQREEEKKKLADDKKQAEDKKLAQEKKLAEEKNLAAEKKALAEARKVAEEKKTADEKKIADEKKAAELKKLADAKAKLAQDDDKRREDYLKRLIDQAGTPSDTPKPANPRAGQAVGAASGEASGAADGDYSARVASTIRGNTTFATPIDLNGNPRAVFIVTLSPDCSIMSVRLKRSSGLPSWDQAAERAIARSDPFPKPRSGRCERELEIAHGPRDIKS
jgi:colicin import membrane protein